MCDGFQTVKYKKRGNLKKKKLPSLRIKNSCTCSETILRQVSRAAEDFANCRFWAELKQILQTWLDTRGDQRVEILCYGLGQFTESAASLHQLAALLVLHNNFSSGTHIFDPLFNSIETESLTKLGFGIIPENEEGKRTAREDCTTLLYLPHCPKQLVNNFLWYNWNETIKNCIIIGNSFSKIIESNTRKTLSESARYICSIQACTKEIPVENIYYLPHVFNDLSVHIFQCSEFNFLDSGRIEPQYQQDVEFITKEIQNIIVEDV